MRYTQKRNGKNVIPMLNAACGLDMPYWRIDRVDDLHSYLSGDAADKLAAYEDAEEQGLIVRLPCKVGDTVFYNFLNKTYKGKLNKVVYHGAGIQVYFSDCDGDNTSLPITKVYGSIEEAEAALKGESKDA